MTRYRLLFAKPGLHRKMAKLIHDWFQWLWKYHYFTLYRTFTAMKVKLLFFFSFVLASAALVQHGAKLPLSNKVEGSENIELLLYHAFCGEKFFLWRRFLLLIVFKFHHTMLVLNAFLAISEGLVSDNQSSPPPSLPLRPHLARLLVRSHHPVKKNTWLPAWLLIC